MPRRRTGTRVLPLLDVLPQVIDTVCHGPGTLAAAPGGNNAGPRRAREAQGFAPSFSSIFTALVFFGSSSSDFL